MNSRILKKLCKRAINYKKAFEHLEQVQDDCGGDPVRDYGWERKSYQRWNGKTNECGYVNILKGTLSFGCYSGGYEPEWDDHPAYTILKEYYFMENTEYNEEGYNYTGVKKLTPSKLFKHYGI